MSSYNSQEYDDQFDGSENQWNSTSRVTSHHDEAEIHNFTNDQLDMVRTEDFEISMVGTGANHITSNSSRRFIDSHGDSYIRPSIDDIDSDQDNDAEYTDIYSHTLEAENTGSSRWEDEQYDLDELSFLHDKYVVRSRSGNQDRLEPGASKMAEEVMMGAINAEMILKQSRNSRCLCTHSRDSLSLASIAFVLIGLVVLLPGQYQRAKAPALYVPFHAINMCSMKSSDRNLWYSSDHCDINGSHSIISLNNSKLETHVKYVPFVYIPAGITGSIHMQIKQVVDPMHSHTHHIKQQTMKKRILSNVKSLPADMKIAANELVKQVKSKVGKKDIDHIQDPPTSSNSVTSTFLETNVITNKKSIYTALLQNATIYIDTQDYEGYTIANDYHLVHSTDMLDSTKYVVNPSHISAFSSLPVTSSSWRPDVRKEVSTKPSYTTAANTDCTQVCLAEVTQNLHEIVLDRAAFSVSHDTCTVQEEDQLEHREIGTMLLQVNIKLEAKQTSSNRHLLKEQPPVFVGFHQATLSPEQHRGVAHIVLGILLIIIGLSIAYIRPTLEGDQREPYDREDRMNEDEYSSLPPFHRSRSLSSVPSRSSFLSSQRVVSTPVIPLNTLVYREDEEQLSPDIQVGTTSEFPIHELHTDHVPGSPTSSDMSDISHFHHIRAEMHYNDYTKKYIVNALKMHTIQCRIDRLNTIAAEETYTQQCKANVLTQLLIHRNRRHVYKQDQYKRQQQEKYLYRQQEGALFSQLERKADQVCKMYQKQHVLHTLVRFQQRREAHHALFILASSIWRDKALLGGISRQKQHKKRNTSDKLAFREMAQVAPKYRLKHAQHIWLRQSRNNSVSRTHAQQLVLQDAYYSWRRRTQLQRRKYANLNQLCHISDHFLRKQYFRSFFDHGEAVKQLLENDKVAQQHLEHQRKYKAISMQKAYKRKYQVDSQDQFEVMQMHRSIQQIQTNIQAKRTCRQMEDLAVTLQTHQYIVRWQNIAADGVHRRQKHRQNTWSMSKAKMYVNKWVERVAKTKHLKILVNTFKGNMALRIWLKNISTHKFHCLKLRKHKLWQVISYLSKRAKCHSIEKRGFLLANARIKCIRLGKYFKAMRDVVRVKSLLQHREHIAQNIFEQKTKSKVFKYWMFLARMQANVSQIRDTKTYDALPSEQSRRKQPRPLPTFL